MPHLQSITLAGGCFWCTEAVFTRLRGVTEVVSGYANGQLDHPSYEQVCSGKTGHAEAVRVTFDPDQLPLADLLSVFFATHDPTQLNRQGNDVGTQYRSGIYYTDPEHGALARTMIEALGRDKVYAGPIVTEVQPLTNFWPAEDYHDEYFARNPAQGYCTYVVAPKVEKLRKAFAQYLKPGA